ncbi:MAG: pyruvoyl-dependent arginine decarboxylase [Planctomycetota bacterium]|jgi:arginine decarboxylase
MQLIPREVFFTKGVGRHKAKLASFEEALRNASIAQYNLVKVSSIYPPGCRIVSRERGLARIDPGQIVYVVMSENATDEHRRLIAASVGLAAPRDQTQFGYLSEHHSYGMTEDAAGDFAEDLAASMLATTLGVKFDPDKNWDERKEVFKMSGEIVRTRNITQSAMGNRDVWTTVVAAAVFLL